MQIPVAQLTEHLAARQEGTITAKLGEFSINDQATVLDINGTLFVMDQHANNALARYLKIPPVYFDGLTPEFRSTLLRYEFDRRENADTVVESLAGEIIAVHQPSQIMLPVSRVVEVITKTLKPEDTVRRFLVDDQRLHVDVTTTDHNVVFYDASNHPEVGDITEAGLRVLSHPYASKPPSVGTYLERLACTNGMVTSEKVGQVTIKGRTVDEVIAAMEEAAESVLSQLDNHLERYAATRDLTVPGSPQAFAAQLAREAGVNRQVLDHVLDIINQLPEPVSVWDVNQAFTNVANIVERYQTMMRLQTLGGSLSFDAERMIERCGTCERLLT